MVSDRINPISGNRQCAYVRAFAEVAKRTKTSNKVRCTVTDTHDESKAVWRLGYFLGRAKKAH